VVARASRSLKMVTLGIDPGTAIMGYGLVACDGRAVRPVDYGALTTTKDMPLARRLLRLYEGLCDLLTDAQPDAVAVEELFFTSNARTAMAVGQARGVALLAAARAGLDVYEYTPLQVKGAVTGYGKASKDQVQRMTAALLGLNGIPRPDDAADALAVAICHAHSARVMSMTGQ